MSEQRTLPTTDHDIMLSVWIWLVGTNGDGLLGKFDRSQERQMAFEERTDRRLTDIERQLPQCWTREDHIEAEKEYQAQDQAKEAKRRERRKVSGREWVLGLGVIFMAAVTIIAPHIWKEPSASTPQAIVAPQVPGARP